MSPQFAIGSPLPICFYGRYMNLAEVCMYVIQHGSTGFDPPAILMPNVTVTFQPDPKRPEHRPRWALFLHRTQEQANDGRYMWRLDLLVKRPPKERRFVVLYTYD